MPTVFELFGLRAYFFAGDHLPIHLHLVKGDASAKIQVDPAIKVISNRGMKSKDIAMAVEFIERYKDDVIAMWNQYCK